MIEFFLFLTTISTSDNEVESHTMESRDGYQQLAGHASSVTSNDTAAGQALESRRTIRTIFYPSKKSRKERAAS